MQKIGLVEFSLETDSLNAYIAWYTDDLATTRFDLYEDYEKYDILNTENCIGAYYRDSNEYYFGNDVYLQKVLKLLNKISVTPGKRDQTVDVIDGFVTIEIIKEFEERNGTETQKFMFKQTLVDGDLISEEYVSPTLTIKFGRISNSTDLAIKPINFALYDSYDEGVNFKSAASYSSAEYYTEDELRLRYPNKLDHLYNYDMVVVGSLREAHIRLKELEDSRTDRIAIDIESTGLGMCAFGPDCITGVVISFTETQSTFYPFRQEGCEYNLPIWFIYEILDKYNERGANIKSCTFNGKMEIESFWKEHPAYIKYSEYSSKWSSDLYSSRMEGMEEVYECTEWDIDYVKNNKNAIEWKNGVIPPSLRKLTVFTNDDGLHTSIKVDQRRGRGIHKLKSIVERITGLFYLELDLIFKGDIRFNVLPKNLIRLYACPDTMNTIRVCRELEEQMPSSEMGVLELEDELNYVKSENEFFGLPMDTKTLESLIVEDTYIKSLLERRFREIHHTSKNIRSNPVKADIFYNRLKAKPLIFTKTGAPSASNAALLAILRDGLLTDEEINGKDKTTPDIAIFTKPDKTVVTYDKLNELEKEIVFNEDSDNVKNDLRKIKKRVIIKGKKLAENKYPSLLILEAFNKACKELGALERLKKKSYNGRFNFYIISDGADSDRQTSDAHQFSDTMKRCACSDSKRHKLISCDYKQVELRVLAFVAGEKELIEIMKDPRIDVHRAIAYRITGTEMYLISAEMRGANKVVNFGVVYGMSEFGLAPKINGGKKVTKEDLLTAMEMILKFYNGLPGVKAYKAESERMVTEEYKAETAFGFIRYFNNLKDPSVTRSEINKAKKAGNNTRIQGFAATYLKKAECLYRQYILEKGWDTLVDCDGVMLPMVRLMLSIHDEVLISSYDGLAIEEVIKMCKVCQEIPVKGAPPFFAAPAFVNNWLDGKNDAYEIPIPFRDKILEDYDKGITGLLNYDTYLKDLNNFRTGELKDYMDDLIRKYKTVDEVTAHVKHPDLTHVLISGYVKDTSVITDHMERIRTAVERYMSGSGNDIAIEIEDNESFSSYMSEEEELGQFISLDQNGEQIVEYTDDDTRNDFEEDADDERTLINLHPEFAQPLLEEYTFYGASDCMIDITKFYRDTSKENIHNAIIDVAEKNRGSYELVYLFGKSMVKVGYKVGYVPDEFNNAIKTTYLKSTMEVHH